ncbi:Hypp8803 [Branchiostoma lanceolatum]|uniref:Hypp8803 protein n=1 Tax=Branchiostoma lanceolatum TaxID=7740 RepID=A0A8J9ZAX0_BRALA|nr:Hypp8803 [Branchiostoma lanceolatum]
MADEGDIPDVEVNDNEESLESVNRTDQESSTTDIPLPLENTKRNMTENNETSIDIDKENENNEAQETQPLLLQRQVVHEGADVTTDHELPEKDATKTKKRRNCREFFCAWDDRRAYYFGRKLGITFVYLGIGMVIAGILLVWISTVWKPERPFAMMIWIGITVIIVGALIIENSNWQKEIDKAKKQNIVYELEKLEEKANEPKMFYGAAFDDIDIKDESGQTVQLTKEQVRQMVSDIVGSDAIHSIYHIGGQWKVYFHTKPARDEFMNKALVYRGKNIRKYVIESKTEEELVALAELDALEPRDETLYGYMFEDGDVVNEDGNLVKLDEDEVCESILNTEVDPDKLYAVEYIRGEWKIYVYGKTSGDKLMKQGLTIRGQGINLRTIDYSKIVQPPKAKLRKSSVSSGEKDMSGVAILKILNLPVIVEDRVVIKNLQKAGCKVKGVIQKQRLKRQFAKSTVYFLNGIRFVRVRIPSIKRFPLNQVWDGYFVKMEVVKVFPDDDSAEQNAKLDSAISALQVEDKMADTNKKTEVVTTAICHVENEADELSRERARTSLRDYDMGTDRTEELFQAGQFSREGTRPFPYELDMEIDHNDELSDAGELSREGTRSSSYELDMGANRDEEELGAGELSREGTRSSSYGVDMGTDLEQSEVGEFSRDGTRPSSYELDTVTSRHEELSDADELSREGTRCSLDDLEGAVGGDEPEDIDIPEMMKRVNGDSGIQTPESGSRTSVLGSQMSNQEGAPLSQMRQEYLV